MVVGGWGGGGRGRVARGPAKLQKFRKFIILVVGERLAPILNNEIGGDRNSGAEVIWEARGSDL